MKKEAKKRENKEARPHMTPSQWQQVVDALREVLPEGVGLRPGYSFPCLVFRDSRKMEKFVSWVVDDEDLEVDTWRAALKRVAPSEWEAQLYIPWKPAVRLGAFLRDLR